MKVKGLFVQKAQAEKNINLHPGKDKLKTTEAVLEMFLNDLQQLCKI